MNNITHINWGILPDGTSVKLYKLTNSHGMQLLVTDYGAIITSILIPVKDVMCDVVLGFDSPQDYIRSRNLPAFPYFGAVVGRYAGRIKNGKFTLNGTAYKLPANNGKNTLHGGVKGFDAVVWQRLITENDQDNSISLSYTSIAGEENFPGELYVVVKYTSVAQEKIWDF